LPTPPSSSSLSASSSLNSASSSLDPTTNMRRLSTEWLLSSLKLHGVHSVESLNQQLLLDHSSANSAKRVNKHYSHEASLCTSL
jgi:hypothetical protein